MSKRFTPSSSTLTGSPPRPLRTTVRTSSAFMPCRASSARFTTMRICGLPTFASSDRSATPGTLARTSFSLCTQAIEFAQVLAVELQCQRRPHAGDQLLDPHLDRLGVTRHRRGDDFLERLLHGVLEVLDRAPGVPALGVLERGVDLHVVHVRGLALLGAPDHGQRRLDLRKALERLGDRLRHRDRFVERGRGNRGHAPHDRAFLQLWHELLAEERKERKAAGQRHDRDAEHKTFAPEGPLENRPVATLEPGHEAGVLLGLRLQDQRGQHRDQRQRQDQRARPSRTRS